MLFAMGIFEYEIVYGDYEKKAAHPDNTPSNHFVHFDSNVREDMNSYVTETRTAKSTFYADHRIGMDGYDRTAFSSYITPHVAHYETLKSIGPSDNGAGVLSGGTPLCVTADDDYCLASLPTTIYLEGWDHSVIDAEISHKFNLGLQFQINRTA